MFPVVAHVASAGEKVSAFSISPRINELLESYCFSCHDGETRKGEVQLDNLGTSVLQEHLLPLHAELGGRNAFDSIEDLVEVIGVAESGIHRNVLHRCAGLNHSAFRPLQTEAGNLIRNGAIERFPESPFQGPAVDAHCVNHLFDPDSFVSVLGDEAQGLRDNGIVGRK